MTTWVALCLVLFSLMVKGQGGRAHVCSCNLCPNDLSSAKHTAGAQQILVDSAKEGRDSEWRLPQKETALGSPLCICILLRGSIRQFSRHVTSSNTFQH